MPTAPYLVIGTSPFNGMDTVDECDSLEEAREFANEHGGKVVKASEYRPKGLLEDWFNNRARRLRRSPRHRLPRNPAPRLVGRLAPHLPRIPGQETGLGRQSELQRRREEP